ncbi:conserved membrane protein of unknown function [Tenacibaculum sp. 190524A02b]|uniref:ABC transporter permease n=1 Tax=Tenacibaculum vairaonense TaxID=3137860 RepID=UPI0032B2F6A4
MNFLSIIIYDFLQRSRTYSFLITLCASLAIAYTFVPEPNASYSTIRIGEYVGYYNAPWFGYVTAIMTSIFLSLIGFYLVNGTIQKDFSTKIGQIIASSSISNFTYLFSKVLSNFLLLFSIVFIVFTMSIILFFLYNDGFPFDLLSFLKPYFFITIPAMFLIASIAVIFEVIFRNKSILQNIVFFFTFTLLVSSLPKNNYNLDFLGSKIVIHQMEQKILEVSKNTTEKGLTIGYVLGNISESKKFNFEGISFPISFLISRLLGVLICLIAIYIISFIFHRFNLREIINRKKNLIVHIKNHASLNLQSLPKATINYSIFPLIKTEFLLLLRKGKVYWLWINLIGMILLAVLPIKTGHSIVLPILWFLQVHRISDLTIKEITNNTHLFSFVSYLPLRRVLSSQFIAGFLLMLTLSIPLLVKTIVLGQNFSAISIVIGSLFIVSLSSCIGMFFKNKKVFEVVFFTITYANLNSIPFTDYFGAIYMSSSILFGILISSLLLIAFSFLVRKRQLI